MPPLLVFINPTSGNLLGARFAELLVPIEDISVVMLPDESDTWPQTHAELLQQPDLRLIIAGGDGTINWLIHMLENTIGFSGPNRPPLGVIPLGTGNDMSRNLNWGKDFSSLDGVMETLDQIRASTAIEDADVWKITIVEADTGLLKEQLMINYFSIGTDACIATNVERYRKQNPKIMSKIWVNKTVYFNTGVKNLFNQKLLKDYVVPIFTLEDGTTQSLDFDGKTRTLVFQSIKSIYSGGDLWRCGISRSMSDKKVEVSTQGGPFSLGFSSIGFNTGKNICQATKAEITTTSDCFYQIDGEGDLIEGPAHITLEWKGNYPLILNQEIKD